MPDEQENGDVMLSPDDLITGDDDAGEEVTPEETTTAEDTAETTDGGEQTATDDTTHPEAEDTATGDVDTADVDPPADDMRQREQAAIERLERMGNAWENALNRFNNNPTDENRKAAEKAEQLSKQAKTALDRIRESDDLDLDNNPSKPMKEMAGELQDYKRQSGETQQQYEERIGRIEANQQNIAHQLHWMGIESENPHLKGKHDDLVNQAQEIAANEAKQFPGQVTNEVWQYIANNAWSRVLNEAIKNKPVQREPVETKPVKRPVATQSIKNKSGQSREVEDPDKNLRSIMDSFLVDTDG